MRHQRAIDQNEKQERRSMILNTAARLFLENPFEAISMEQIARESGLAKGTLYLYFKTKEALFLEILRQELDQWFTELEQALNELETVNSEALVSLYAGCLTDSLSAHPLLLRLLPILHAVLERNISIDEARAFKLELRDHLLSTGSLIENRFSFLQPGQGVKLLLEIYALLIGLQSMSEPAPAIAAILSEPGMELFQIDLKTALTSAAQHLLTGLARQTKE
jgi:AcrR family transcriptional regulator